MVSQMAPDTDIRDNLEKVKARIAAAAAEAGRSAAAVTLVAVAKSHPAAAAIRAFTFSRLSRISVSGAICDTMRRG